MKQISTYSRMNAHLLTHTHISRMALYAAFLFIGVLCSVGNVWGATYTYRLVVDKSALVDGKRYILLVNNRTAAYNCTTSSSHFQTGGTFSSSSASAGSAVTTETAASSIKYVTLIRVSGDTYKILDSDGKYMTATAAKSGSGSRADADDSGWNFTGTSGMVPIYQASGKNAHLRSYSNSFRTYADDENGAVIYLATGCSVTYNANGATSGTVPSDTYLYGEGGTVTAKTNSGTLAKTGGYTFSGWNTKADGTGTDIATSGTFTITKDTVLYAKWSGGASCDGDADMSSSAASLKGSFSLSSVGVTVTGMSAGSNCTWSEAGFVWSPSSNTTPTVGGTNCDKETPILTSGNATTCDGTLTGTFSTGNTYYYRAYGKNNYGSATYQYSAVQSFTPRSITFNLNGHGSSTPTTQYVNNGGKATDPSYSESVTGYTFGGWYKEAGCSNSWTFGTDVVSGENKTLYAKWTANKYDVTLSPNSGSGSDQTVSATYDDDMPLVIKTAGTAIVVPTRTGYDFGGYYNTSAASGGTQYYTYTGDPKALGSARTWDVANSTTTLYARWIPHQHKVSVSAVDHGTITATPAGGSAISEGSYNATVDYDKTITLGWTKDDHYSTLVWTVHRDGDESTIVSVTGSGNGATFTMPDYDVVVKATISEDPYKLVTFKNNGTAISGYEDVKVYVGERPVAPTLTDGTAHDACDATSDKHYGWTQDTWSGTIATQASMDEDYTVYTKGANLPVVAAEDAATITYNAVWAESGGGSESESITAFEDGDYFIVDTRAEVVGGFFALNGAVSSDAITVTDISSAVTENALAGTITIDLEDAVITDAMKYRLTTIGDSITIQHISTSSIVSQKTNDTKFETTGTRNWIINKHATDNRFTIQSWFTKSGDKTSCLLMQYSNWVTDKQVLTLTAKPFNASNMGGTAAKAQNYMSGYVYLVPAGGTSYSTFLITCCDKNVTLATNSPSHGSITFSPDGTIATCGADAATRQTTMTVTPDAGYYLSTWSTSGVTPYSVSPAIAYGSVSNSGAQATMVTFTQNTTTGTYTANATFTAIPVSSLSLRAQQTGQSDKVGNDLTMSCYPKEGQTGGNDPLNHTLKVLFEEVLPSNALDKTYDWSVQVKEKGDADWTAVSFDGNVLTSNKIINYFNKNTGALQIKSTEGTAEIKITAHDGSGVSAKVTITVANVPLSSLGVSKSTTTLYVGQSEAIDVSYTPLNTTTKGYTTGSYSYVTIGNTNAVLTLTGKSATSEQTETVTLTSKDTGGKTATVTVTVKPLPLVHFVDNIHNESFDDVVATTDGTTVTFAKATPTHDDLDEPGSGNTCEKTHLHLIGWIRGDWPAYVAYMNGTGSAPSNSDLTGATGYFYAPGASITLTDAMHGKTFYAVWAKVE